MAAKKLVEVSTKAATKASRSAFKNLLRSLRESGEKTAIGEYRGGFGRYSWYPGVAKIGELATANKYGTERLAPLEDVLSQRMANPEELALEAIKTGRLDGKKISSQQRRQIAATVANNMKERSAVESLETGPFILTSPGINLPGRGGYSYGARSKAGEKAAEMLGRTYSAGSMRQMANLSPSIRRNPPSGMEETKKAMEEIIAAAKNLPEGQRENVISEARNIIVLKNLAEQSGPGYRGSNLVYAPDAIRGQAERLRTMRESTGIEPFNFSLRNGLSSQIAFDNLRKALELTTDNPRAQEMIRSMYKEWEGTGEELANAARLLSD